MAYGTKIESINKNNKNEAKEFLKMKLGEKYIIRILPKKDGTSPFVEVMMHYNLGVPFICPRTFNKQCPICDYAFNKYRVDKSDGMKEQLRPLFTNQRTYVNVFLREQENGDGSVKIWSMGKTTAKSIYDLMAHPEYGDITNTENGFDLIVSMEKDKASPFSKVTVFPKRRESSLASTERRVEEIMDSQYNIMEYLKTMGKEEISKILKEYLEGTLSTVRQVEKDNFKKLEEKQEEDNPFGVQSKLLEDEDEVVPF